jgi:oxygen-dependent protoporphyrinogen oxidase
MNTPRAKSTRAQAAPERVDALIVGGGITGLTTAWRLMQANPSRSVVVLEADARAGGAATTDRVDGFCFDRGANGFLTGVPDTWQLAHDLGLGAELQEASTTSNRRWVWHRGRLVAFPMSPVALLTTPLLSPMGRLRLLAEPWVGTPAQREESESMLAFAQRRIGAEAGRVFIPPVVTGISAGPAALTEAGSLLPRMVGMEVEHGSLIRAALRRKPAPGRSGRLTSFRGAGMGRLTDVLIERLGARLRTATPVTGITRVPAPDGRPPLWRVQTPTGTFETPCLVLAIPARHASPLLRPLDAAVSRHLDHLRYADIRVFGLGWQRGAGVPTDGFGFLVPRGHGVRMLGCLWSGAVFPDQAPAGGTLMRAMVGGTYDPAFAAMPHDEALALVRRELQKVMGITRAPDVVHETMWAETIPQYRPGHQAWLRALDAALDPHTGLWLAGNSYRGIGINDCVNDGDRIARDITQAWRWIPSAAGPGSSAG